MTIIIWCKLNFVPGDGMTHWIIENRGTDVTTDRIDCFVSSTGILTFILYDKDSAAHQVDYDISGWAAGETHQIVCRFDLKNDEMELYTDGASRDASPSSALSGDSLIAIGATTFLGQTVVNTFQLNGAMTILIENRSWSDAEITANYDSGDGTPPVITAHTIYHLDATNESTGGIYWPGVGGKFVTASSNSGTETTLTTAGGALTAFEDGGEYSYHDGTGYGVTLYGDGAPPDDTTFVGDDSAGALVSGAGEVGVSINCDGTHYTQGGNVLNIVGEDFEIDFWMKQDGDPAGTSFVLAKRAAFGAGNIGYAVYILNTGILTLRADDNANDATVSFDMTAFLDNKWHYIYIFADRSDISACAIYVDGISKTTVTAGTFPVNTLTNGNDFTVGAQSNSGFVWKENLRDITIHIGGTMRTAAQILYRATHPLDYSANGWTLDGTREAWKLTENTGTTNSAEVTSPANDLTLSNAAAWDIEAYLSANLYPHAGGESGNIGAISDASNANLTLTSDSSDQILDKYSDKIVFAAADDGDNVDHRALTLTSAQEYWVGFWTKQTAKHADTALSLEIDGSATPIVSRRLSGPDDLKDVWIGGNLDFNGTSDYVNVVDDNTLDALLTFEAWVKPNEMGGVTPSAKILLTKHANFRFGLSYSASDDADSFQVAFQDSLNVTANATWDIFTNGNFGIWYHVVGKFNASSKVELFVNGVSVDESAGAINDALGNGVEMSGEPVRIGGGVAGRYTDCEIAIARAYSIAVSDADIAWLAQNPGATKAEIIAATAIVAGDIELYLNFEGDVVTDQSGNGNDGVKTGTTYVNEPGYKEQSFTADQAAITFTVETTGAGAGANSSTLYIDGVDLQRNLVANGSMEGGADPPTGWTEELGAVCVSDNASVHSGTNCAKITAPAASTKGINSSVITVIAGEYYTLSAWVKSPDGHPLYVYLDNDGWTFLDNLAAQSDWYNYQYTFKAITTTARINFSTSLQSDGIYVDDVSLVRNWTRDAAVETKGSGYIPLGNPLYVG
jgi:hypothetical protein